ncbi:MAG: S9 family peptidase [Methylococcales bacterium]|nr:S9 family peptidase [Methylococcales bacterium]
MSHFKTPGNLQAPIANKRPHTQTHHNIKTKDDYFWLRADNWQEAMREPEKLPNDIKQYLKDENDFFKLAMSDTESLQEKLIAEMRGRIQENDTDVSEKWDNYNYNTRYKEGSEYPIMVRATLNEANNENNYSKDNDNTEEILIDGNIEAQNKDYFELGETEISPNHQYLAWSSDENGSENFQLRIRNLSTATDLDYTIADVDSVAWCDNQTLFYTQLDENHHPNKIFRHIIGTNSESDVLVIEEKDKRFFMSVARLLSGRYLLLSTGMNDQSEHWFIPTDTPEAKPQLIEARQEELEYSVDHQDNQFIITTNADGAEDFKIVSAPIDAPNKENWTDIVPHQLGRMILGVEVYADWLIWMERENGLPSIVVRNKKGDEKRVGFDEEAYSIGIIPSLEYQTDQLRFSYSSPTRPSSVFDYNLKTNQRELRKRTCIPSGHNPDDYITRRLLAKSHDGEKVPVTILYHHSTQLDGTAPCLLYGYGSYGHSIPASFSSNCLSLVNRGFIYAIAHVRGGEEKGRHWYETAKFAKKPNTFHDFIAVSELLIANNYTKIGNIVCEGASAGGLLVGAVANMRPDLFAGVIGDVPFVDILNTILDDSLPLTPGEWSQWGNPIESAEAYGWIASYSPYDNVTAQDYPAMLVNAGVSDPRVTYWEPVKWVAKLRKFKTDDNILLLKTNMTSGHFGTTGRFAELEDVAQSYAFILKAVGKA